jgi:predicted RecA/RadA family phage recombinase
MAKNFVQAGSTLTLVAPANVKSGGVVVVGALAGIAAYDASIGEEVEVVTEGVFTLPKTTPGAINQGDAAYWDSVTSKVTTVAGSNLLLGICVVTAGTSETTCSVKLTVPSGALAAALAALAARVTVLEGA